MSHDQPTLDDLRSAVQRACQPTRASFILEGRKRVAAMPRGWVLDCVRTIAHEALDLSDYWEYGRLLELLNELGDTDILKGFVSAGLGSTDVDVREMAELWAERIESHRDA